MKKKVFGRKLSRERDTRGALLRGLARALILYGKINTTKAKAKMAQPFIERLVSLTLDGSLSARRRVYALLGNDRKAEKLLRETVASFSRKSGFTRIVGLLPRRGDSAELAQLAWSEEIKGITSITGSKGTKSKGSKIVKDEINADKESQVKKSLRGRLSALKKSVKSTKESV